jgi:hypothetical protein
MRTEWMPMSDRSDVPPAQPKLTINDSRVVKALEAEFAGYDRAFQTNDVATLNNYFFDSPTKCLK